MRLSKLSLEMNLLRLLELMSDGCTFYRESSRACSSCALKGSYLETRCHTFGRCNFHN